MGLCHRIGHLVQIHQLLFSTKGRGLPTAPTLRNQEAPGKEMGDRLGGLVQKFMDEEVFFNTLWLCEAKSICKWLGHVFSW